MTALACLLDGWRPADLLDVGCGNGTWLCAAMQLGIEDVAGLDGVALPQEALHVPAQLVRHCDLGGTWGVTRRFELVLSLEVAEHLSPDAATGFVQSLTSCGDRIFFSAATPWQEGQHHVNCQWPEYWQKLFNQHGFACRDVLRWKIWNDSRIEPWYRQNIFFAEKHPEAGREPRIPGVIHPDCMASACRYWRAKNRSLLVSIAEGIDRSIRRLLRIPCYE